jgi:hypothetical protein
MKGEIDNSHLLQSSSMSSIPFHDSPKHSLPFQTNKPNKCLTEGCNGKGNIRNGKKTHSSQKYCPNK